MQLGGTAYVYPGACHTRFEHCIGVSHLAGQMCEHIASEQPELGKIDSQSSAHKCAGITASDILCVRVAALCHDLGHGTSTALRPSVTHGFRSI